MFMIMFAQARVRAKGKEGVPTHPVANVDKGSSRVVSVCLRKRGMKS